MRPNELLTCSDNGAARTQAPGCQRNSLGLFKEEEEENGIASDVVEVKGEDPATGGYYLRCVDTRKPRDCNNSPLSGCCNKEEEEEKGIASDVVEVKGEDPATPGYYLRSVDTRKPWDCNNSPLLGCCNKAAHTTFDVYISVVRVGDCHAKNASSMSGCCF